MTADAEVLLERAGELLDAPDRTAAGNSARLAAFLTRQAVEDLIDARCAALCGPQVLTGTRKAKLAVLKSLDSTTAATVLSGAWYRLTGFCHQHAYELAPTVAEVREECIAVKLYCLDEPSGSAKEAGPKPDRPTPRTHSTSQ